MAVGIKAISDRMGLSVCTVSHILSGRDEKFAQKTRDAVWSVAKELGYEPNCVARGLRSGKTRTIGVVVHGVDNNFRRIDVAERLASHFGYQILLSVSRWESEREEEEIKRLLRQRIDGLLVISPAVDAEKRPMIEKLAQDRFPMVSIGQTNLPGIDYVDWTRAETYRQMTRHLLEQGCRRFIFLGRDTTAACFERVQGIQMALGGVAETELKIVGCRVESWDMTNAAIAEQLSESFKTHWPDAVICHTDHLALASMKVARAAGYRIPDELAITGCSNFEYGSLLDVPLTTIKMPDEELVTGAMEILMKKIERNSEPAVSAMKLVPAEIILRESSRFTGRKV